MRSKHKTRIATVGVIVGCCLAVLGYVYAQLDRPVSDGAFHQMAAAIVDECKDEPHRPSCYDKEIPKLMNTVSLEDIFEVIASVQELDSEYRYCHVLGHTVSALEVAKDPAQWKNVVTRCPLGVCANGCQHGAFQERFRSSALESDAQFEQLLTDLETACEPRDGWNPTPFEQSHCYHGLGHLTVYATDADVDQSLEICKQISRKDDGRDYFGVCADGLFMQVFQPIEPEDFALVEDVAPTEGSQLDAFCSQFQEENAHDICYQQGWPLVRDTVSSAEGTELFCSELVDPAERDRCFRQLFYIKAQSSNFAVDDVVLYCSNMIASRSGTCFASVASAMVESEKNLLDRALSVCGRAEGADRDQCYNGLVSYARYYFHKGSEDHQRVCQHLPEPWRTRCNQ